MLQTSEYTHSANHLEHKIHEIIRMELSADEITPIAFSKCAFFQRATYGLFVEITVDANDDPTILYTIRRATKHGYKRIIERESCFDAIQDSWAIYYNA